MTHDETRIKERATERLTIEAALRQAYSLGHSDAGIGLNKSDKVSSRLREIQERLEESLPRLDSAEAVVTLDMRSQGWTKLGRSGLEVHVSDWASQSVVIEYRAVLTETGSAGD